MGLAGFLGGKCCNFYNEKFVLLAILEIFGLVCARRHIEMRWGGEDGAKSRTRWWDELWGLGGVFVDGAADFAEEVGEEGFFLGSEAGEDEVDVAELCAELGVVSAEAEAGEIVGAEVVRNGFEAVVAATGAFGAVADGLERQVEIVADGEDVGGVDFVVIGEISDGEAGVVVEIAGFEENAVAIFEPDAVHFGVFPGEIVDFGIKIQGETAEIMARPVINISRVSESDN